MPVPAGYQIDQKGQPLSIAELKQQAAKLRPAPATTPIGVDQPTQKLLVHLRAPARATEQSEHARQLKPGGTAPPANIQPSASWGDVRAGVTNVTEPQNQDDPVTLTLKRAARGLFGVVDFIPETAGIVKNLFSEDPKVSEKAESDLLALHPGAQISDRGQEALEEWRKSPKLAGANLAGDALSIFLTDKLVAPEGISHEGVPHEAVRAAEAVNVPPPEAAAQLAKDAPKVPLVERRVDLARRKRIDEMNIAELRRELLTSDKTGLPNRRAFEETQHGQASPAVAMSDADGLKALNDRFGYEAGDALLQAKAEALSEAGLDAYHDKGDEFYYRGESPEDLEAKLEKAREILRNRVIEVKMKDGTTKRFKGADFSYGAGKDIDESESGLKQHKSAREQSGERARGELRGITEVESEKGGEHPGPAKPKAGDHPAAKQYPVLKRGGEVSGLKVRSKVPNRGSIGASLDDYTVLPGVREVKMADFVGPKSLDQLDRHSQKLAGQIQESNEIDPLIVVLEKEGPYILEGGHRFDALSAMGKESFPAVVVVDEANPPELGNEQP